MVHHDTLERPTSELRQAAGALRPFLVRSAGFTMVAGLLMLAPSWYMLEVYDRVVNSRNHFTLLMLTVLVLAAYVVMEVLEWAHARQMQEAAMVLDARLADRVFTASFEAQLRRLPGGASQAMGDLRTLREFLPSPVPKALMEAPVALVFLVLIFAIGPLLGWSALAGAVLQTGLAWMNQQATQSPLSAASRGAAGAQQYAEAVLRNAQVIEALGMLRDIHTRWLARQREFLGLQAVASDRAGLLAAISKFLQTVMGSLLLGLAAWLLLREQLHGGAGMMIVASILGGRMLRPLVQVVTHWRTAAGATGAWQRLERLLESLPAAAPAMPLPAPRGMLTAENLVVTAPGSQHLILRGITFGLNPGEVLAVVGPSASGKTTLARVLTGLWPSTGGKARLDGVDIHGWAKAELGPHVGFLPQGVELFDGTLAENIARFGPVDMQQVESAARAVGLHETIAAWPEGYGTQVGADGRRLSGGERQRVGLARALYGGPRFVVLDEPNSSLDEAGDAALAAAIQASKAKGTTFVVITHRISVLGVTDKLLVLHEGSLQAYGRRDDVLAALQKAREQGQAGQAPRPATVAAVGFAGGRAA